MSLQTRTVRRDSIKDARNTMRDIVSDHIAHKQRCEPDTHHRIYQIEPVVGVSMETTRQQCHDGIDERVQHVGCHRRQYTHHKRQDE